MLHQILMLDNLIFYILAIEVFLLILSQLRTNGLLKKTLKIRAQKKEHVRQFKEEVRNGKSEIPVVKFEKESKDSSGEKRPVRQSGMDQKEMAVLQEMMTEFFG